MRRTRSTSNASPQATCSLDALTGAQRRRARAAIFMFAALAMLPGTAVTGRAAPPGVPATPENATERVFRTAQGIRQLTPAEAERRHPARLRALVTAFGRPSQVSGYFVMEDTGPIFVARGDDQRVQRGIIELTSG